MPCGRKFWAQMLCARVASFACAVVPFAGVAMGQVPGPAPGSNQASNPVPVVVELFTSEGCSSCVPADELLAQIDRGGVAGWRGAEVIAMGEHVDYWDSAQWRDRFSSALFSSRQQDYGIAFQEQNVFTPQVVVNGQTQCVGSDMNCIRRAVIEAVRAPRAEVSLHVRSGDTAAVSVQHLPAGANGADILLGITESDLHTNISGGENRGRGAAHAAVVRSLTTLGRLEPKKSGGYTADIKLNLNQRWNRQNVKLVLLVQDRTTRRILGAAVARPN
jgi:hypothetical protein